jgi:two-component system, chemotaxis family, sensor kinase Cph1
LTPKSALALSLALHELATNAAKFGAFSKPGGKVAVDWQLRDDGGIGLSWTESGGPAVNPPTRRGFGSNLIERALAMETDGHAAIRYERAGVICDIILPASSLVVLTAKRIETSVEVPKAELIKAAIPPRPRILVVEDSFLLVLTLEGMCDDLGWEMVGPATRLKTALLLAEKENIDAALLDVNLAGEMSWAVADVLKERGIPFAFTTGYDGINLLPDNLADSTIVTKPYQMYEVEQCLRLLMTSNIAKIGN